MNLEIAYQELSKSDFITTYGKGIYELCKQGKFETAECKYYGC